MCIDDIEKKLDDMSPREKLRLITGEALLLLLDIQTDEHYLVDQGGMMITRERAREIFASVERFFDENGDDIAEEHDRLLLEKRAERIAKSRQHPNKLRPGWVYFVKANGLIKIGMTTREPDKRLEEFVPKMPYDAKVIATVFSKDAKTLEEKFHLHFADRREKGEWFRISDNEAIGAINEVAL
jgi:hypothetical protein